MLEVIQLSKKYGSTLAVDKVSFRVPDGRVGILLGPNGAGKSTVIKSIAGLLRFEGSIRIQGLSSRDMEAKRSFAYVPEIPSMYEALTVREHMEFIKRAYGLNVGDQETERLFDTESTGSKPFCRAIASISERGLLTLPVKQIVPREAFGIESSNSNMETISFRRARFAEIPS